MLIKKEEVKSRQSLSPRLNSSLSHSAINIPADESCNFDINHDNIDEFDGELIDKVSTEISNRRLYSYRTKDILYSAF